MCYKTKIVTGQLLASWWGEEKSWRYRTSTSGAGACICRTAVQEKRAKVNTDRFERWAPSSQWFKFELRRNQPLGAFSCLSRLQSNTHMHVPLPMLRVHKVGDTASRHRATGKTVTIRTDSLPTS